MGFGFPKNQNLCNYPKINVSAFMKIFNEVQKIKHAQISVCSERKALSKFMEFLGNKEFSELVENQPRQMKSKSIYNASLAIHLM